MFDELGNVVCDTCGVILTIGCHPFCPHGDGASAVAKDGIPGGVICENYGPEPIRFDSHSDRRAYMAAHGLQEKERFCPMPGSDVDPQGIQNPKGYVDAQTLANGAALICRQQQTPTEFDAVESGVMRGFFRGELTTRDAKVISEGNVLRSARLGRRIKNATHTG